jgi:hypothetical protein
LLAPSVFFNIFFFTWIDGFWEAQVLMKGKQFLLLIRHLLCYSYIQSNPVSILTVIEKRKHLHKK